MVQLVFMRLPQFPEIFPINVKQLKMRPGTMEQTRTKRKLRNSFKIKQIPENKVVPVIEKDNGRKFVLFKHVDILKIFRK